MEPKPDPKGRTIISKPERPLFVTIISYLLIISGTLQFGMSLVFGKIDALIGGLVSVIVGIGLLKMKKWALWLFTALVVIRALIFGYLYFTGKDIPASVEEVVFEIIIGVIILVYLWAISKKFM